MATVWEIRHNAMGSSDVVSVFTGGEYVVARDLPIEDARLIAAAPDMQLALERLLGPAGYTQANSITDQAKAALARARGEVI